MPMASITELIRKSELLTSDPLSFENLWIRARLFGVGCWILSQIDEAPGVHVWVPSLPQLHILNRQEREELATIDESSPSSSVVTCGTPLPTQSVIDLIVRFYSKSTDREEVMMRHPEARYLTLLSMLAGITHWSFCLGNRQPNAYHGVLRPGFLNVIPWPADSTVEQAHPTPGELHPADVWNPVVDAAMLDAVIQQQISLPVNTFLCPQTNIIP